MAVRSHHIVTMTTLAAAGIICMTSTSEGGQFSPGVEASLSEASTSDSVDSPELCMSTETSHLEELFCADGNGNNLESMDDDPSVETLSTKQGCMDACKAGAVAIEAFCRVIPDPRIKLACFAARVSMPLCFVFCARYY
jgi:hypothetical protein